MSMRLVGVMVLLLSSMAAAAELPGLWIEAEKPISKIGDSHDDATASGGRFFHLWSDFDLERFIIDMPAEVEQSRLFVRYRRKVAGPMRLRVQLVRLMWGAPAGTTQPAPIEFEFTLPADTNRTGGWLWVSTKAPRIPAGKYQITVSPNDPNPRMDVDLLGFVNMTGRMRWSPPNTVEQGKLVGDGGDGPVVTIESFEPRSPVRLVFGEETDGGAVKPIAFDAVLANAVAEPVSLKTTITLWGESGEGMTLPGPQVQLAVDESRKVEIPVTPPGFGWYRMRLEVGDDKASSNVSLVCGVIRRPVEGLRPDSLFGLNIHITEQDLVAAKMMGLKWRRGTPYSFDPSHVAPAPGKWVEDKDVEPVRAAIRKWKDAGILTLGLVNYNTTWNVAPGPDGKPVDRWRNRPIDLNVQAEIEYRMFKALRGEVSYWEIWNEPWVSGWTWQTGTAQDYREMSRLIWEKTKPEMPEIMLIGGGSTSYQRDILFAPGNIDIGYADGCSTHPYNSPDRTMPSSAAVEAALLRKYSRSKGAGGIWATEVGAPTYTFEDVPVEQRQFTTAKCVAPLYLLNKIGAGDMPIRVFYYSSFWGQPAKDGHNLWDGPDPQPGIVAFSTMTHFLEDGKLVEDVFAASTAMWGPMFVKPDGSTVIAFWAEDGFSGTLAVPTDVFEVYNYLGARVVPKPDRGGFQRVPFGRWETFYLVSKKSPDEVRRAVASIGFEGMDTLRINPRSFTNALDKLPPLRLKVQNLRPGSVQGEITVSAPPEIELAETKHVLSPMSPGEIRYIEFPLKRATPSAVNRYKIDYTATIDGRRQAGSQVVQAAFASFGTPVVDGKLDDWAGVTPVTMLSRGGKDFLEAALDPRKAEAILSQKTPGDTVAYRVWTRWDDTNFYLAAEVPNAEVTYKPLGAKAPEAFAFNDDNVMLAFDCLEPNPDDWFVNHPLREKCLGSEVDYEFAVVQAKDGDSPPVGELHRLKAPGTNYQTIYATNVPTNPPLGVMNTLPAQPAAGQVAVSYDAATKTLRYEVAIPWTAIKELGGAVKALQAGQSHTSKFAFGIADTPKRGKTFWTQEAGDFQSGAYGFSPTWLGGSTRGGGRILTDWGFVR